MSQSAVIEEFIKRERPLVVTDAMSEWTIMKTDHFWFDNITEVTRSTQAYQRFFCFLTHAQKQE
jgi:hypothetical protein